jgi:hypothetical protein
MVTQTNRSSNDFMRSHPNLTNLDGSQRYFRFNVEQGLQGIGLEEFAKKPVIEAATQAYMTSPQQKMVVAICAKNLKLKNVCLFQQSLLRMIFLKKN